MMKGDLQKVKWELLTRSGKDNRSGVDCLTSFLTNGTSSGYFKCLLATWWEMSNLGHEPQNNIPMAHHHPPQTDYCGYLWDWVGSSVMNQRDLQLRSKKFRSENGNEWRYISGKRRKRKWRILSWHIYNVEMECFVASNSIECDK